MGEKIGGDSKFQPLQRGRSRGRLFVLEGGLEIGKVLNKKQQDILVF